MLRTGIRAQILARSPGSPLYVRKVWKNEIRLSLSLTDIASCEAVLNDVRAFDYSSPTALWKIIPQSFPRAMR
ncbi:putative lateral flagellar associated protein [Escherichia coli]|uniref:Putative lateral flagellar associated protein n=1 Tax=Escherichia coli TaxID=562 RepID=A0A376L005_ECOLX|nr:putative lateral flagellar associated protein [Escherichia coli]